MKVLWLASWYPNKYEPVNGDFIQRHALAVQELLPIDVIHVVQLGKDAAWEDFETVNTKDGLREFIYGFSFKRSGIAIIDKIRYNAKYLGFYRKILMDYSSKFGKPDLIHVHVPIKAGIVARRAAKKWNIPYMVSEQASYYESAAPDNFFTRSFFFRQNARKVFRDASAVTNVSATIGETIKKLFNLKKVHTIHNLADTKLFRSGNLQSIDPFTWLHVSALGEQKNISGMLRAFSDLKSEKNWKLVIVGPSDQTHHNLVQELELTGRIEFTGKLSYSSVAAQMQKAHAFVLFSNHENFPCVVVEALCSGLPVVASDVGGVKEAINPSNGLVVEPGNIDQLTSSLQNIMANYHLYDRAQISTDATSKYNPQVIANHFLDIYREVTSFGK